MSILLEPIILKCICFCVYVIIGVLGGNLEGKIECLLYHVRLLADKVRFQRVKKSILIVKEVVLVSAGLAIVNLYEFKSCSVGGKVIP